MAEIQWGSLLSVYDRGQGLEVVEDRFSYTQDESGRLKSANISPWGLATVGEKAGLDAVPPHAEVVRQLRSLRAPYQVSAELFTGIQQLVAAGSDVGPKGRRLLLEYQPHKGFQRTLFADAPLMGRMAAQAQAEEDDDHYQRLTAMLPGMAATTGETPLLKTSVSEASAPAVPVRAAPLVEPFVEPNVNKQFLLQHIELVIPLNLPGQPGIAIPAQSRVGDDGQPHGFSVDGKKLDTHMQFLVQQANAIERGPGKGTERAKAQAAHLRSLAKQLAVASVAESVDARALAATCAEYAQFTPSNQQSLIGMGEGLEEPGRAAWVQANRPLLGRLMSDQVAAVRAEPYSPRGALGHQNHARLAALVLPPPTTPARGASFGHADLYAVVGGPARERRLLQTPMTVMHAEGGGPESLAYGPGFEAATFQNATQAEQLEIESRFAGQQAKADHLQQLGQAFRAPWHPDQLAEACARHSHFDRRGSALFHRQHRRLAARLGEQSGQYRDWLFTNRRALQPVEQVRDSGPAGQLLQQLDNAAQASQMESRRRAPEQRQRREERRQRHAARIDRWLGRTSEPEQGRVGGPAAG